MPRALGRSIMYRLRVDRLINCVWNIMPLVDRCVPRYCGGRESVREGLGCLLGGWRVA